MDINCDIGEINTNAGIKNDLALMMHVDSVNIACGFHAGNYKLMATMVEAAIKNHVKIGAHPGYSDPNHFGRVHIEMPLDDLKDLLSYQIGALKLMVEYRGHKLHHVKLHGALYNLAMTDVVVARVVTETIKRIDDQLIIYGMYGSKLQETCLHHNVSYACEFFADRHYHQLLLAPRTSGGVIEDLKTFKVHCQHVFDTGNVKDIYGDDYKMVFDTICVHSDHQNSLENVLCLKQMMVNM